jgi:hypothetical protein
MKRDAQIVLARPLAAAIWHWIDLYPDEFADAISGPRRLEGAPERVSDLINKHMQPESKHLLWPTLTVLMCISFERLKQDFNTEGGGNRKTNVCCFLVYHEWYNTNPFLPLRKSRSSRT